MATHTPGPWKWRSKWGTIQSELVGSDGRVIYIAEGIDGEMADDNLVEAAPDLLSALEGLMPLYSRTKDEDATEALLAARAAIAKATGEAP